MEKVVLASNNQNKLQELQSILTAEHLELIPQSAFAIGEAEETGLTFVENAILKARYAARHTGLPAIADDSGLEIDALKGEPGIYSARYAQSKNDQANLDKVLTQMQNVPEVERGARFQCVIVCLRHERDPTPIIGQGTWDGKILSASQGQGGFGYDPIFVPNGYDITFGEMDPSKKQDMSHRADAFRKLVKGCFE